MYHVRKPIMLWTVGCRFVYHTSASVIFNGKKFTKLRSDTTSHIPSVNLRYFILYLFSCTVGGTEVL